MAKKKQNIPDPDLLPMTDGATTIMVHPRQVAPWEKQGWVVVEVEEEEEEAGGIKLADMDVEQLHQFAADHELDIDGRLDDPDELRTAIEAAQANG